MLAAPDIATVRYELSEAFRERYDDPSRRVRLVGILFAPPTAPLARDELLPRIGEYHYRSGNTMDICWAGYGRYWPRERAGLVHPGGEHGPRRRFRAPPDTNEVGNPNLTAPWLYSQTAFEDFRSQMERETRWRYSGEVDLLLLNARYDEARATAELQLTSVVALNLARAIADGAIFSAAALLQELFRYAETQDGLDPQLGLRRATDRAQHRGRPLTRRAVSIAR